MRLGELVAEFPIHAPAGDTPDLLLTGVTDDSRAVEPGMLFVARAGSTKDGRQYLDDALARGASAVLTTADGSDHPNDVVHLKTDDPAAMLGAIVHRWHGDPTRQLRIVGVTGTNGKTTVATLLRQILREAGRRCGLLGTIDIDDGARIAPAELTTPGAPELAAIFARMVANGCTDAVMEVSSHALDQQRVAGMHFTGGIFTNLSGDHLDYHGTMNAYRDAKARLFAALPGHGFAVINARDDAAAAMREAAEGAGARVIACGDDPAPSARVIARTVAGTALELRGAWGTIRGTVPLVGVHNAMNVLEAVAAAHELGLDQATLARSLPRLTAPPGRLEPVASRRTGPAVFVDYAHTDDALVNVLQAVRPLVPDHGTLRVVFGCGGDRDRTKRPRMMQAALNGADDVMVTSDNPRTEDPSSIVEEILAGVPDEARSRVSALVDREEAIHAAITRARPADVVIIAGKGHEDYQIVGTERRPFDDRLIAAEALSQ